MQAILGILTAIVLYITIHCANKGRETKSNWWILCFAILAVVTAIIPFISGMMAEQKSPSDVHTNKFNVRMEVRQELLNGQETKRDTVYIFTPKKK